MSHPAALRTSPGRRLPGSRLDATSGGFVAYAVAAASARLGTVALADGAGEHGDLAASDPAVTDAVVSHRTAVLTACSTVFFGLLAGLLLRGSLQVSRRWLVVAAWAVLSAAIGASRLYLGYHWLTDVLAAWCLAVAVLAATAAAVVLVERRRQTPARGGRPPYAGGSHSASEGDWSDARLAR